MTRKLFYFVRHGESILNSQGIRQGAEGSLSDIGKTQAEVTGKRLVPYQFQVILASPYTRTKETADIINSCREKKLPVEYVDLLKERRNPSEIVGKSIEDPEIKKIVDSIDQTYHSDSFRFSDEENFEDLKERARQLLAYLTSRTEKSVLVVTHGHFLRIVVAYLLYGEELTSAKYNVMSFVNDAHNAAITVCEYNKTWFGPSKKGQWNLIAWDDYIHEDGNIPLRI